jgi:hypothetical protein
MKDNNQTAANEEQCVSLTIYKSEEQVFQRLYLCEYLGELPEITNGKTENSSIEEKE